MNDNYLWDRTGEVDPEIKELEEILGTLRYQPQPLRISANIDVGRRRSYLQPWAIAAALALLALALGLWLHLNRGQEASPNQAGGGPHINQQRNDPAPLNFKSPEESPRQIVAAESPRTKRPHIELATLTIRNRNRGSDTAAQPKLTKAEQAEKDQLVLALRLVSAKLNIAQRKTQGAPALNVIRNQHPLG